MGYRDRERRDPYLRRLSETIRKSEIEGLRAAGRAAELSSEIERRKRSEEANRLLEQMHEEKASVLERILACSSVHKDKWYEHLNPSLRIRGTQGLVG